MGNVFDILTKVSRDVGELDQGGWEFYPCHSTDFPIVVIQPFYYKDPFPAYFVVAVNGMLRLKRSNHSETLLEAPIGSIGLETPKSADDVAYAPQSDNVVTDADRPDWFARKVVKRIMEEM